MASNAETQQKETEDEEVKYPKSIFLILGNEFCERFNYYGLRTVLTLYLTQKLHYSDDNATMFYHLFTFIAYFTPCIGAVIADCWLGKFRTIFFISIFYAVGSVILSIGSIPHDYATMNIASIMGLIIIGMGTGGIKPCVSAFGGDQFQGEQVKHREGFFSLFYFTINAGSVISTFVTPFLRGDIHCFGEDTCYPLAFGIPAILMILAVVLFVCGKPLYVTNPPEGNIMVTVFQCISHALKNKFKNEGNKRSHWLDYADDKFDKSLINGIKNVMRVLILYIPLPVYWTLFDQTGSTWTLQATRMDSMFLGFHIKPDQMQILNPFLILAFIPLFEYAVYPVLNKFNLLTKPLQKITTGGLLVALSFIIAALIEFSLESSYAHLPDEGYSELNIINNSPCNIKITGDKVKTIRAFESAVIKSLPLEKEHDWKFAPSNCSVKAPTSQTFSSSTPIESMLITLRNENLQVLKVNDTKTKSKSGDARVRLFFTSYFEFTDPNTTFKFVSKEHTAFIAPNDNTFSTTDYIILKPGKYAIYFPVNSTTHETTPVGELQFGSGGSYIPYIYQESKDKKMVLHVFTMVNYNSVNIILQVPQYTILTAGEIMFSVTGLEFSYSQSPSSMKSMVQAAWLLTTAFGSVITCFVSLITLKASYKFLTYAAMLIIDLGIFSIMAHFYKYVRAEDIVKEEESTAANENKKENDE